MGTHYKESLVDILMSMTDGELFLHLKLMTNTELSRLGCAYPMLCNRVVSIAEQQRDSWKLHDWANEVLFESDHATATVAK
jgi:hypothetical protein